MEYGSMKVNEQTANFIFTRLTYSSTQCVEAPFRWWVLQDNDGRDFQLTSRSLADSEAWADTVKNWTFNCVGLIGFMYTSGQLSDRTFYVLGGGGALFGGYHVSQTRSRVWEVKSETSYRISKNIDLLKQLLDGDYGLHMAPLCGEDGLPSKSFQGLMSGLDTLATTYGCENSEKLADIEADILGAVKKPYDDVD